MTGRARAGYGAPVRASWARSASAGLDPDRSEPPLDLDDAALEHLRRTHPLGLVMPVVRRLLVEHAVADDLVVAVTDASGRLLWVEGSTRVVAAAEAIRFAEGTRWDERSAGTNAPALALALDAPVRVRADEHFLAPVQRWSCSAAPVHDPRTGQLLGALDVTGDDRAASSAVLALVQATAAAAERELLLLTLQGQVHGRVAGPHLTVLGPAAGTFHCGGEAARLSLRHAEVLLLLGAHPEGLTADALAALLDERDLDPVTVRAEVSRLRRALPPDLLAGKPYRLTAPVRTDAAEVRALLDAGRLREAVAAYTGPLLARSVAPGVVALREELECEVRAALLRSGEPDLLLRWGDTPWGAEDPLVWQACQQLLPPGPRRDRAAARAALLDARLAR